MININLHILTSWGFFLQLDFLLMFSKSFSFRAVWAAERISSNRSKVCQRGNHPGGGRIRQNRWSGYHLVGRRVSCCWEIMLPLAVVWLCCFIPFSTHSPSLKEPGNLVWSMHTFQRTVVSSLHTLSPKTTTTTKSQKLSHPLKGLLPVSGFLLLFPYLEHSDLPALRRLSLAWSAGISLV